MRHNGYPAAAGTTDPLRRIITIAAITIATMLAAACTEPGSPAERPSTGTSQEAPGTDEALVGIETLPGYEQTVGPELRERLEAATVEIGTESPINGLEPGCTGIKLQINDEVYVLTARHCMEHYAPGTEQGDNTDITGIAIMDLSLPLEDRANQPMGWVTALAIDPDPANGSDFALLKIASNPAFDAIPAVDATELATQPLQPGTSVYLYGAPQQNHYIPLGSPAVYMGQFSGTGDPMNGPTATQMSELYNVVAVRRTNPDQQPVCRPGASGSNAVAANGQFLGTLSYSTLIGNIMQPGIPLDPSDPAYQQRVWLEQQTGIRLDDNNGSDPETWWILCSYSAAQPDTSDKPGTISRLLQNMVTLPYNKH